MLIFNDNNNLFRAYKTLRKSGHCHFYSTIKKGLVIIEKENTFNNFNLYINGTLIYCFDNPKSALKSAINRARMIGIY